MSGVRLVRCAAALLLAGPGCSPFWRDRGRDALDVWTAGAERQGYGLRVVAGPFPLGLYGSSDPARGAGLAGGRAGRYEALEMDILLVAVQGIRGGAEDERRKDAAVFCGTPIPRIYPLGKLRNYAFRGPDDAADPRRLAPRYTQMELGAGLFYAVRLGVNPGELADLLAGFAGLDLYGDDRATTAPEKPADPGDEKRGP